MEYNTKLDTLVMHEYGRNIQQMVELALMIENRAERTLCAKKIADTMVKMFPGLRTDANYKQKVWDHIAMISGYKLDVDAPFELPKAQEATVAPTVHVPYPSNGIDNRTYGRNVQQTMNDILRMDDHELRMQTLAQLALFMKSQVMQGHKDINAEERVCADIYEMSGGQLNYDFATLMDHMPVEEVYHRPRQWRPRNNGSRYQNNRNRGGNQNKRRYRRY